MPTDRRWENRPLFEMFLSGLPNICLWNYSICIVWISNTDESEEEHFWEIPKQTNNPRHYRQLVFYVCIIFKACVFAEQQSTSVQQKKHASCRIRKSLRNADRRERCARANSRFLRVSEYHLWHHRRNIAIIQKTPTKMIQCSTIGTCNALQSLGSNPVFFNNDRTVMSP